jgi:hypothetical protein
LVNFLRTGQKKTMFWTFLESRRIGPENYKL